MRYLWIALLLLVASPVSAVPNIIFVLLDDVTACMIGDYTTDAATSGSCSEAFETPVIDSLADAGVMVTHAWGHPVCSPYRASLMTGTMPRESRVGAGVNPDIASDNRGLNAARPTFVEALRDGGYRTEMYGKHHLAEFELGLQGVRRHPIALGFQAGAGTAVGVQRNTLGTGGGTYEDWERINFVDGTVTQSTTYATTSIVDDAIVSVQGSEPFFLFLSFQAPHTPLHKPPTQVPALYTPTDDCDGNLIAPDLDHVCYTRDLQAVDTELGRLFDPGETWWSDIAANTIVIITSDNGMREQEAIALQPLWEEGRCKGSVGECGLWVPLIVAGAGIPTNETADIMVQSTDWHATILDMAGIVNPAAGFSTGSFLPSLGGREYIYRSVSFWRNLQDTTSTQSRSCIYAERFVGNYGAPTNWHEGIRSSTYKLMRHNDDGEDPAEELYLTSDLREAAIDLIATPYGGADLIAYNNLIAKMNAMNEPGGDPCR